MEERRAARAPGWGEVALDTVIALFLPKVGMALLGPLIPDTRGLAAAGVGLTVLAFFLIGRVRGSEGLIRHLARVVGFLCALMLVSAAWSRPEPATLLFALPLLGVSAALGGWAGARRS